MNAVRELRERAHLTQAELAELAGTSQPTIASYEAGRKSPTLRTLKRLADAADRHLVISFVPTLTREDRRSLALHRAISRELLESPARVLSRARRNLTRMRAQHGGARVLFDEWARILEQSVDEIVAVMTDHGVHARDLRQVTPFAGVLSAAQRTSVYAGFARSEVER